MAAFVMSIELLLLLFLTQPQFPTTGDGLYRVACASCHGEDGRGVDPSRVGFETPLPNFTDCRFASREPDLDWMAVTHAGGPARSFATSMPAYGEVFSEEQIQLILDHIRGFCADRNWPRGELNAPLALFTEKAYPEDELVWRTRIEVDDDFQTEAVYERRFGARNQWELRVPFTDDGIGNVAVGIKRALYHSLRRGSIVSVLGEVVLPTAEDTDEVVFEPMILVAKLLPSNGAVQLQAGVEIPEDVVFWRGAVGKTFTAGRFGRSFSPMLEILGEYAEERSHWDAVPQVQVSLNKRQHVLASAGYRFALTEREFRSDALVFYVLWDWFDGGFFSGW